MGDPEFRCNECVVDQHELRDQRPPIAGLRQMPEGLGVPDLRFGDPRGNPPEIGGLCALCSPEASIPFAVPMIDPSLW